MLQRRAEGHYDALDSMDEHDVRFFIPVRKRGALRGHAICRWQIVGKTRAKRKLAHRAAPLQEGVCSETPQARLSVETRRLAARGGPCASGTCLAHRVVPPPKKLYAGKTIAHTIVSGSAGLR